MKLPYCESAVVNFDKITGYLLSTAHPNGRHKAKFFMGFGFSITVWQQLVHALIKHAEEHEVTSIESSLFGTRYIIEGGIASPDLRDPLIRAVWFVETNDKIPYLVTAYPLERKIP